MTTTIPLDTKKFRALIFDLDGVLTQTAAVHAAAWKQMFDAFFQELRARGQHQDPFDKDADYSRYVDGKPRYEGVKSLLEARGIDLPYGSPQDSPDKETVCGLGNRKNEIFHQLLKEQGARVFADGVALLLRARAAGLANGVVTSSRNGRDILDAVELTGLFDIILDGNDAAARELKGKPSPDIFLTAARELGVAPAEAVVLEDAISGVQAGKAGDFGLVVGVDRVGRGHVEDLMANGADVVFSDLSLLTLGGPKAVIGGSPPQAMDMLALLRAKAESSGLSVFLDYDGTLTPIVPRPEDALLSNSMRTVIDELARRCPVGIVSGRDLADVKQLVNLQSVFYAGDHGFNIDIPGGSGSRFSPADEHLPAIRQAADSLRQSLEDIPGAWLEEKTYTLSIHYRETPEDRAPEVAELVTRQSGEKGLRMTSGKKVFELRPGIDWDKGKAIAWLREELDLNDTYSLYLGDDTTDEDGFKVLGEKGLGILVTAETVDTAAGAVLNSTDEVEVFLRRLVSIHDQILGEKR